MKNIINYFAIKNTVTGYLLSTFFLLGGCKKYITVDTSPSNVSTISAFKDNSSAIQVISGLYALMNQVPDNGTYVSLSILPDLYTDNLAILNKNLYPYGDYYTNSLESQYLNTGGELSTFWSTNYSYLFTVNTAIEQLTENEFLSPSVASRLLGEAYFLRAFFYFHLVNFYGEVPLVLSTNYDKNKVLPKNPSTEIYAQIEADLNAAENLLDQKYVAANMINSTTDRIRPNLSAVLALKARVYLYQEKYVEAETAASIVIDQPQYSLSLSADAFLKNSTETIWALPSVTVSYSTWEGSIFILQPSGPDDYYPFFISSSLLNAFEPGDERKANWLGVVNVDNTDYYFPAKYKIPYEFDSRNFNENKIMLRLSEVLLIRAEARNEQGKTVDAIADLNLLRDKRRSAPTVEVSDPLPALSNSLTQEQLRPLIFSERRTELFTEGGHRLFDLRRSGTIDAVMTAEESVKGGTWAPYKVYFPISRFELTSNPNMKQTPGYAD